MTRAVSGDRPIGVGLVGVQPGRSWGAVAHLPALAQLADRFRLVGIANSSSESAQRAVAAIGDGVAFSSVSDLIASPDVELVVVTVKVPHHFALVEAALAAGKHVYCEWPLATTLAEAEQLARLASASGSIVAVGTQAVFAPAIEEFAALVRSGAIGTPLSSTLTGYGMTWGELIEQRNTYLLDVRNGATMLTIAVGHALSAVEHALGRVVELSARLATRRPLVTVRETSEHVSLTAPDQVMIDCLTAEGLPLALHYRGGLPRGDGLFWQVDGTEGSVRISGPSGLIEMAPLTLSASIGDEKGWSVVCAPVDHPAVDGVRRFYEALAAKIAGEDVAMPDFASALRLHRVIAAIEEADRRGCRVAIAA
ncbi:Gfo/Idh/MocA family protein [Sphingomonas echinoides]|uniref:Gfo/Idh/MocA family oxidoreductase n=1 Tax=Sphingomonas echinoides TaxID=59803 RepID=A0ABU4PMQ8_9SPHN|nr:Gfo/Idh/MocA family oxidoreductase [Sphingomonas echinoides]MDX5985127.1 Gfo/Idh/MocA family oxidoreductase [Sphingomonas echinoides]